MQRERDQNGPPAGRCAKLIAAEFAPAVTSVDDLDEPAASFDCAVVDHHGLTSFTSESRRFLKEFEPVVLLANTPAHPMAGYTFRTLTKPFLGPALSEAVKRALATRASAWSSAPPPRQDG